MVTTLQRSRTRQSLVRDPLEVICMAAVNGAGEQALRMVQDVRNMLGSNETTHSTTHLIALAQLRVDGGTQPRAEIDPFVVDEYAEAMRNGAKFPPVSVFYDGALYWLADGFHRASAARKLNLSTIEADVRQGTRRDAVLFSAGANAHHGLRRTNGDKRRAVEMLLRDAEWSQWSDREVARRCGVSHDMVNRLRKELSLSLNDSERAYTTKHGKPAKMRTKHIGKAKQLVYDHAPETIKEAVKNGEVSAERAAEITEALENLSGVTKVVVTDVVVNHNVQDPAIVPILARISRSTSDEPAFDELAASGVIQRNDGAIPLASANALDLQRFLDDKAKEHRRAAFDQMLRYQFAQIQHAPAGVFSVVYADPAWQYDNAGLGGAAENHYPTMPTEDICVLPQTIDLHVADNAVLFLWSTNALLPDALRVVEAWGFRYVSNIAWDKEESTFGKLGFYVEGQHELLLIAVRGSFQPNYKPKSVLREKKRRHSEKPRSMYSVIETMYPNQRYIELFARKPEERDCWAYWGLEAEVRHADS